MVLNKLLFSFQTTGHSVSVHMGRCSNRQGVYNPYNVSVGDAVEMAVCNEATGSRFQQRLVII